jgi:amino acid transporter
VAHDLGMQTPGRSTAPADGGDAERLRQLGYEPQLRRGLGALGNVAMGFATISPVVGLYAVVLVGMIAAGPAWVWTLPVCLVGQCLLLAVYAELASQFPVSGGAYQWTRRLLGPTFAWGTGWLSVWAYMVANTTIAYLAAPWVFALAGVTPSANGLVAVGAVFVVLCSLGNAFGIGALKRLIAAGIAAEAVASVVVGLSLLLVFRTQDFSLLTGTLGAEALSGGSAGAFLAALAVGGWAFIGFDACVLTSEETRSAARHVPRAVWWALLSVGALVILNAFAVTLAHPDPAAAVAGTDLDPVSTAVVTSFGGWAGKPFAAVVLLAFVACGLAAQGASARAVFSIARDGVLPGSALLRRVDRRQTPIGGLAAVTVVGCAGLLLGLHTAAIGSLIAFGTAVFYLVFLLIAVAALVARVRGTWVPRGTVRLGRAGTVLNVLAVLWLGFEFVNIAWPRAALAPVGAPWYQVWAAPLVIAVVVLLGAVYLLIARPQARVRTSAAFADRGEA